MIPTAPDGLHPRPTFTILAMLAILAIVPACSDRTADAAGSSSTSDSSTQAAEAGTTRSPVPGRSLGTIEATLDGEARVWHVVEGQASDGPYASGVWLEAEETVIVSLGGLDSADPPIETFSRGGAGGEGMSMGDYEGSSFSLQVQLPPDATSATFELPADEGQVAIVFAPVFDVEDFFSGTLTLVSGTITVESVARDGDEMEVSGTFEGTLQAQGSDASTSLTDGRFEVAGLPEASTVQPGGDTED